MSSGSYLPAVDSPRRFQLPAARQTAPSSPKLMQEDVPPPMTLGGAPIEDFHDRWYVIQCTSGKEKFLAEQLAAREIRYFLPLKKEHRLDRGRKYDVWLALFSGYMFFSGSDGDRFKVIDTRLCVGQKIISVLSCANQAKLRDQLVALHRAQLMNPIVARPLAFGASVKVVAGPWQGHEGFVDSDGMPYAWLRLDVLGIGTPVQVPREFIEEIQS